MDCPKRLISLHHWIYSKTVWIWSWAAGCGWLCVEQGRLNHMSSKGAFQPQSLCDLKSCCLSSAFSPVYKLLINILKTSISDLATVTAGAGKAMLKTPGSVVLAEQWVPSEHSPMGGETPSFGNCCSVQNKSMWLRANARHLQVKSILSIQKEFKVAFYFLRLDLAMLFAALARHLIHRYNGSVATLLAAFLSALCMNVDSCARCRHTCSEPEYKLHLNRVLY